MALCKFVVQLATVGLRHCTIKSYMAGIRHLHIGEGLGDPFLLHGVSSTRVKRSQGEAEKRERLPITPLLLHKIKSVCDNQAENYNTIMLWAACCLTFFGFLRAGELTVPSDSAFDPSVHLSWGDLAVDNPMNPTIMSVRLKASKTDPFRKGITLYICRVSSDLCPVSAMLVYLVSRGKKAGPLFAFQDG